MAKRKYLLPCTCGQRIPVEVAQAGQEIRCACGAILEIPTLQGLRTLEQAVPETAPRPRATWDLRQQLILLGATISLAALLLGGYLHIYRPRLRDIDSLSIVESMALWQNLRAGVRYHSSQLTVLDRHIEVHRRWMGVTGVIAAVGLLTMASSLLVPKRRARKSLSRKERPSAAPSGSEATSSEGGRSRPR